MADLLVDYLIADAARLSGDPNMTRITHDDWSLFYQKACRELCEKANVLQFRATFDLTTEQLFPYPDEMTVFTKIEANLDPVLTPNAWYEVTEKFEDEFRDLTNRAYPTASIPRHYFAQPNWFFLIPSAEALIPAGARITYFGLPDRLATIDPTTVHQLPQITQDYVIERMRIFGMQARNRLVEAQAALQRWQADLEGLGDNMLDRSKDRPSSIAPRANRYAGMR